MAVAAATLSQRQGRPSPLGKILFLVAACTLGLTLGQALSSLAPQPAPPAKHGATPAKPPPSFTVNVEKTTVPGRLMISFPPGTSAELAQAAVQRFGLTFVSGDAATGRYLFDLPQISLQVLSPATALALIPQGLTRLDALQFFAANHLRLLRWLRPLPEQPPMQQAEVALPVAPAVANPPRAPSMRTTLPRGLSLSTIAAWARAHGLRLQSYNSATGLTTLQPLNPYAPVTYPPAFLTPPAVVKHVHPLPPAPAPKPVTPPAAAVAPRAAIYIGFAATATDQDIQTVSDKYNLQLTALGTTGLKVAMV